MEPGGQPPLQRRHAPGPADPGRGRGGARTCSSWSSVRLGSGWRRCRATRPTGRCRCGWPTSPVRRWSDGSRHRSSSHGLGSSRSSCASSAAPRRPWTRRSSPTRRLDAVVRAGFAQRRKMLRRSLAGVVEPEAFVRAGIRPDARAEELGVEEWGRLAPMRNPVQGVEHRGGFGGSKRKQAQGPGVYGPRRLRAGGIGQPRVRR